MGGAVGVWIGPQPPILMTAGPGVAVYFPDSCPWWRAMQEDALLEDSDSVSGISTTASINESGISMSDVESDEPMIGFVKASYVTLEAELQLRGGMEIDSPSPVRSA